MDEDEMMALVADLKEKAASALAIEALWNGDTRGWFVYLSAVLKSTLGYESHPLHEFREGGDIRLFTGEVPPWPEALNAARIGGVLAMSLSVPFHFPSPDHPENECPHWWEISRSYPCSRCDVPLLQAKDCRWRGVCSYCSLELDREAKEAQWSQEERSALRCWMCGKPVVGAVGDSPMCQDCRDNYLSFSCSDCGTLVTVHRKYGHSDTCGSCAMAKRLSALSISDRQRLREAAKIGTLAGIAAARDILKCDIGDAKCALAVLLRIADSNEGSCEVLS